MADVQHKRGTRSDLNTLAAANGLLVGQVYFITDEDRLSIATSVSAYQAAAKEGEGGSLELYAENPSSPTAPSATGANAVAIGSGAICSGISSIALSSFSETTGNYAVSIGAGADALGQNAVGIKGEARSDQATAIGSNSGTGRSIAGIVGTSSTKGAMALGGSYASGTDSFAAAIGNNTSSYGATGANSVAIGATAKATATNAVCISKLSTASGVLSTVLGGSSGTASGATSLVLGGGSNTASGELSTVKGYYGNTNGIRLKHATGVYPNMQGAYYVLGYGTTDATPIALNTSVWTPSATNQIILPNNSAFAFHGTIVARQQASTGTACAAWKVEGLIRREGTAGTTVLVNSATTILDNTPAWGMTLSANTTFGGLKIEVTGAAGTNIRFVATINTSEVTY
jgi:hypothetical protein